MNGYLKKNGAKLDHKRSDIVEFGPTRMSELCRTNSNTVEF